MQDLPNTICFLCGDYTALQDARISVLDRGFIFGDGVYEVVPIYDGRLFRFTEHMARLARSLAELKMPNPYSLAQWLDIAEQLIARNAQTGHVDKTLYIQISRGVAPRDHAIPPGLTPTVFAMVSPLKAQSEAVREMGVSCVTADDFRWRKGHIKSTSLLAAVLARQISVEAGAAETIMLRDGFLSEASSSNVWVVKDGQILGTLPDNLVLEGIRYGVIQTLCQQAGIPFELRRVTELELRNADEVLLSSATKEVLAVTQIDGKPIGTGLPGPIYHTLYKNYQGMKAKLAEQPEVVSAPAQESLIEFPSLFPIKVMGPKVDGFVETMTSIAANHDPDFEITRVQLRDSKGGKYLSVTLTVTATSREQLDNLYRELTSHPLAKYVL
jgi:D-alanine transaminase